MRFCALAVGLFVSSAANAHEWYDSDCCNDQDCAAVPVQSVKATPEGWLVKINPDTHFKAKKPMSRVFPYDSDRVRESQDGAFHVCAFSWRILCLYTPPMGY